ncbi:MAG: hypothetical protein GY754_01555 [bacterium]|nr:hypothetical protein [bacterium]
MNVLNSNNKKIMIFSAVGVLVLSVLLAWLLPGANNNTDGSCSECEKSKTEQAVAVAAYTEMEVERESVLPANKILEDYKKSSIYPPNSRPLTPDRLDLLNPDHRYEVPVFINREDGTAYLFTADKHRVFGNESITFSLTAARALSPEKLDDNGKLPVSIISASLLKGSSPRKAEKVSALTFVNTNDDLVYTCTITPAQSPVNEYHGRLLVSIEFESANETMKSTVAFEYSPESSIPALFTGKFSESIKDGSLYIYAEIEVKREGFYIFDANLYDAGSEPAASTRHKQKLPRGKTTIPLHFFGKVLIDKEAAAPFSVKNLRGYLVQRGETPGRAVIPPCTKEYKTANYSLDQFSGEEYTSEFKQRKLEYLKNAAGIETASN